jgi:uncharacterized protein with ParB-like and HNH nuclease domain
MRSNPQSTAEIFSPQCQYVIPIFQRHYVWNKEDQWEPLWEDLVAQVRVRLDGGTPKPHFCGAIVIDEKKKALVTDVSRFHVIDGQQRLTTFQIILSALRDVAIKHNDRQIVAGLGKLIFNSENPPQPQSHGSHKDAVELRPTKFDRQPFFDVLFSADREKLRQKYFAVYAATAKKGKQPPKVIALPNTVSAYLYFYDQISKLVSDPKETFGSENYAPDDILAAVSDALLADFHSVVILLDNSDDAQIIFESLNYRGQPLLASDLIRNYAFMRAEQNGENIDQVYTDEWSKFEDRFWIAEDRQGRLKKPRMEYFFANFLASCMGEEVNHSRIYQEYLGWIAYNKHQMNVREELHFISGYADVYRSLVAPTGPSDLANFARFLGAFDITIAFPLVMAFSTSADLDMDQKTEMMLDLESYLIRRAICGRTPKNYNKLFLSAIKSLRSQGISPQNLRQFLSSQKGESADWPGDEELQAAFIRRPLYRELSAHRLAYILRRIEDAETSNFSEEITIHSDLSIEHVMPQGWCGVWPLKAGAHVNTEQVEQAKKWDMLGLHMDALGQAIMEREDLIDTIGNLTLLTSRLNSSVSNGPFAAKRSAILQQSALRLNRYFQTIEAWDEETIIRRSEYLFNTTKLLWPHVSPISVGATQAAA